MSKVLIVTTELTNVPGLPTGGRGARLERMAEGLRAHGHETVFAFDRAYRARAAALLPDGLPETVAPLVFDRETLDEIIGEARAEVALFSPWTLVLDVRRKDTLASLSVILDMPGLLTLENAFEHDAPPHGLMLRKIAALQRADLVCVACARQRYFLYPLLHQAGADLHDEPICVVPTAAGSEFPPHQEYPSPPLFVAGGVCWRWQDYGNSLRVVADHCAAHGGRLRLFSDSFLYGSGKKGQSELAGHPAVSASGLVDFAALQQEYCRATAAVELYRLNPERRLAFTTRTMDYLAAGLPVIYAEGMELGEHIRAHDAGWVIPADDGAALRRILAEIADDPDLCRRKGQNAQRLARERFASATTVRELAAFCAAPRKRHNGVTAVTTAARVLAGQCELICMQQHGLRMRDRQLGEAAAERQRLVNELQEQRARQAELQAVCDDGAQQRARLQAEVASAQAEIAALRAELARITGRLAFRVLLRLKKAGDALLYLCGLRRQP